MGFKSIIGYLIIYSSLSFCETTALWSDQTAPAGSLRFHKILLPTNYRTLNFNLEVLKDMLGPRHPGQDFGNELQVRLPLPDGNSAEYIIREYAVAEPGYYTRQPEVRTFLGSGITRSRDRVSITLSARGLHVMILSQGRTVFIDPDVLNGASTYLSYYNEHLPQKPLNCGLSHSHESHPLLQKSYAGSPSKADLSLNTEWAVGDELLTYRMAMASSGKYTQKIGGYDAMIPEITKYINDMNLVYIRDVSVKFVLVEGNDQLIFSNPDTDPYQDNSDWSTEFPINYETINDIIGIDNYDIGHFMSDTYEAWGGVSPCRERNKADGLSFNFWALLHEVGHQFSAPHTTGNYGANSTHNDIMGRSNDRDLDDNWFHIGSQIHMIEESRDGRASNCAQKTVSGNTIPVVSSDFPDGLTIPASTPFLLTGSAVDADAQDELTYTWQQYDLDDPLFMGYFPDSDGHTRYVPLLQAILDNDPSPENETLPTRTRVLTFRLVTRDNNPTAGGMDFAEVEINVTDQAGPFVITSQNSRETWNAGSTEEVTWDVAGTDSAPVNASTVDIVLSLDGGETFTHDLALDVPNSGSATVTVPELASTNTTRARLRVKPKDNIFLDINNADFTIQGGTLSLEHAGSGMIAPDINVSEKFVQIIFSRVPSEKVKVELMTVQGKLISSHSMSTRALEFQRDGLSGGIYILRIRDKNYSWFDIVNLMN